MVGKKFFEISLSASITFLNDQYTDCSNFLFFTFHVLLAKAIRGFWENTSMVQGLNIMDHDSLGEA